VGLSNFFRHDPHTPGCLLRRLSLDVLEALTPGAVTDHFHYCGITDLQSVPHRQLTHVKLFDIDLLPHLTGLCAEALFAQSLQGFE